MGARLRGGGPDRLWIRRRRPPPIAGSCLRERFREAGGLWHRRALLRRRGGRRARALRGHERCRPRIGPPCVLGRSSGASQRSPSCSSAPHAHAAGPTETRHRCGARSSAHRGPRLPRPTEQDARGRGSTSQGIELANKGKTRRSAPAPFARQYRSSTARRTPWRAHRRAPEMEARQAARRRRGTTDARLQRLAISGGATICRTGSRPRRRSSARWTSTCISPAPMSNGTPRGSVPDPVDQAVYRRSGHRAHAHRALRRRGVPEEDPAREAADAGRELTADQLPRARPRLRAAPKRRRRSSPTGFEQHCRWICGRRRASRSPSRRPPDGLRRDGRGRRRALKIGRDIEKPGGTASHAHRRLRGRLLRARPGGVEPGHWPRRRHRGDHGRSRGRRGHDPACRQDPGCERLRRPGPGGVWITGKF